MFARIESPQFSLSEAMRPAEYLYENMQLYAALEQMKQAHITCALIIDEFGVVNGLVTMKDIMEALVGELPDAGEEPDIVEREDGSFLADGQCPIYNFLDRFDLTDDFTRQEYNTLGGLILDQLGHMPRTGETVSWRGFDFEVVDMDGARIDKVMVKRRDE